ncbi:MAG: metal transporter [Bacteroidota bacterium]
MRNIICTWVLLLATAGVWAQERNKKVIIAVDGKCEMCKARIEKAALGEKGVKYALWDIPTRELSLILDERKTDPMKVKTAMAKVGHDTEELKASDDAYASVHPCCRYREDDTKERNPH